MIHDTRYKTRIMVFGVFDLLHPGHINFLKQARRLGDFLVVSIARDANVFESKGKLPVLNEDERAYLLKNLDFVDRVVLGGLDNPWAHIKEEKPQIIALGFDQKPYLAISTKELESELKKREVEARVVRIRAYYPRKFKSSKVRIIEGTVVKGSGRGKALGFPTANLKAKTNLPEGIYIAITRTHSHILKNVRMSRTGEGGLPSLVFIGPARTFGETKGEVEVYILDFEGNLYGEKINVELLRKIRDNIRFSSAKDLIGQMNEDQKVARKFFSAYNK